MTTTWSSSTHTQELSFVCAVFALCKTRSARVPSFRIRTRTSSRFVPVAWINDQAGGTEGGCRLVTQRRVFFLLSIEKGITQGVERI